MIKPIITCEVNESSTSVVDGEMENKHVTRGETDYGVRDSRENSQVTSIIIIILCVSPLSGSCIQEFYWFWVRLSNLCYFPVK